MIKGVLIGILCAAALCGCQENAVRKAEKSIIGTWQSEGDSPWRLVFSKKGTFKTIYRFDSIVMDIAAEGLTVDAPEQGVFANYVFGPCQWSYDGKAGILNVKLIIDDVYMKAGDAVLEGSLVDTFKGPLSEDGKTWTAYWVGITQWHDGVPDQVTADTTVVFHKIE